MKLVSLTCKHCGANLMVNPYAGQVTCEYCGSKLLVNYEGTEKKTRETAADPAVEKVDSAMTRLDMRSYKEELPREHDIQDPVVNIDDKREYLKYIKYFIIALIVTYIIPGFRPLFVVLVIAAGCLAYSKVRRSRDVTVLHRDQYDGSIKSRLVALVLCLLLGILGAHYFYVGKKGMGILYLLTLGLFGIGWIVDIIRIACGTFRDDRGFMVSEW